MSASRTGLKNYAPLTSSAARTTSGTAATTTTETDKSQGESEPPRPTQAPQKTSFKEIIKAQFRQIAKAITEPPAPAPKRRRTDETREALKLALEKLFQWTKPKKQRKDAPADDPALTEMEWRDFWGEYHHTAEGSAEASHTCERPETSIHAYNFAPQF